MGRWVTSKGRRIYIPDEGEEVPEKYQKNVVEGMRATKSAEGVRSSATTDNVTDANSHTQLVDKLKSNGLELDAADSHTMSKSNSLNGEKVTMYDKDGNEYQGTYNKYSDGGREIVNIKKTKEGKKESLKKQINKDFDTKEKQIANNKKQADTLNNNKSSLEKAIRQAKINAINTKILDNLYEKRLKFSKAGDGQFIVNFEQIGGTMSAFKALAVAEGFEVVRSDGESVTLRRKKNK